MKNQLLALLALSTTAASQSLLEALSTYNETSRFRDLATANPSILTTVTTSGSGGGSAGGTGRRGLTFFVPSNNAFAAYETENGSPITSASAESLISTLKYHVLASRLTKSNFTRAGGITVPTLLDDEIYNNRTAGMGLSTLYGERATGQVLFVEKDPAARGGLRVRQIPASTSDAMVRGGLGESVALMAVDGTWDGGRFHIVDGFLTTPKPCSKTIRDNDALVSLDRALNRSSLYPILDTAKNVTCLAPDSAAFVAAGSPDQNASQADLISALTFHTLPMPLYSDYLKDGMEIMSLGNLTVRVSLRGDDIYFNDARVKTKNVLTNNGLIHVLEKVMTPLSANSTVPNVSETSTAAAAPSSTETRSSAASSEAVISTSLLAGLAVVMFVVNMC